ncbi:TPA: hypothetical protein ACM7I4_004164, partial [Escherichia coli]
INALRGDGPQSPKPLSGRRLNMKQSTFPVIVSTTGHVFSVVRVTLCTICLKHEKTGEAYVVIFTDCHNIRDYKKGVVPALGELYQEDVDLITGKS